MKKMLLLLAPMLLICSMDTNALDAKREALRIEVWGRCGYTAALYKKLYFPIGERLTPEEAAQLTSALEQGCEYIESKLADDVFFEKLQNPSNFDQAQAPFMQECYRDLGWAYKGEEGGANMYERFELMHTFQYLGKSLQKIEELQAK